MDSLLACCPRATALATAAHTAATAAVDAADTSNSAAATATHITAATASNGWYSPASASASTPQTRGQPAAGAPTAAHPPTSFQGLVPHCSAAAAPLHSPTSFQGLVPHCSAAGAAQHSPAGLQAAPGALHASSASHAPPLTPCPPTPLPPTPPAPANRSMLVAAGGGPEHAPTTPAPCAPLPPPEAALTLSALAAAMDASVCALGGLPQLRELHAQGCMLLGDAGMQGLTRLSALEVLELGGCRCVWRVRGAVVVGIGVPSEQAGRALGPRARGVACCRRAYIPRVHAHAHDPPSLLLTLPFTPPHPPPPGASRARRCRRSRPPAPRCVYWTLKTVAPLTQTRT